MLKVSNFIGSVAMVAALLGAAPTTEATQANASKSAPTASGFVADLQKHWTTAQGLAVAVAEAMPAEDYSFKPVPEEMSFGEQMMHIADANYGYCALLTGAKSPFVELAKDAKIEKADAVKQLTGSFEYCSAAFSKVSDADLDTVHEAGDRKFVTRDVMLGVMIHMAHHRGQAEVYPRLKGIKPPEYKS